MAGTTILAVRRALVAGLKVRTGLAQVLVTYHFDGDDRTDRDAIWTAFGVTRNEGLVASTVPVLRAGVKRREETYTFGCMVEARMGEGRTQQACDERCVEVLFREVEEYLATDPYLGNPSLFTGGVTLDEFRIVAGPVLGGRLCRVEAQIRVNKARLL